MKRVRRTCRKTRARLDALTRGMIWGMHLAKMPRDDIQKHVAKKDGTVPTLDGIDKIIAHKRENPEWMGEESRAGGRPSGLTEEEKKELVKLVFRERGKAVVTVPYCRKKLRFLKKVSVWCCRRALHDAGLKWLGRRCKSWVPPAHKAARLLYCAWLRLRQQKTLDRQAYTDGTTWYLARGPADEAEKQRVALGKKVWRMSKGKDGLWDDNISPSLYAKSQGKPVKIWGFLANGRLEYWVLPQDYTEEKYKTTNMTGERYNELVKSKFAQWRRKCFRDNRACSLVQDHERCLWQDRNLEALAAAGCPVVANFPKSSPDLNAIEGVWQMLKSRMLATEPETFESRAAFLARLRRQVNWLNDTKRDELLHHCTNQKERAKAVEKLLGAKCSW